MNKFRLFPAILVLSCFIFSTCSSENKEATDIPIYLNTAYSFDERAADLVSRMTLEEKQSQLGNVMPAIPRLGVNAYNLWGEALHGVVGMFIGSNEPTTSFPNSVAIGASWDPDLMEREAKVISDEARALNSEVISNLTFWSPVVEPVRDPRWGRTGECFGEDPFLIAQIGGGFVRGMMGYDKNYLKAVPCGKHYFANNSEFNRHTGSSDMDQRDAREYYLAPYKSLIEDDNLPSIMSCYNAVNGVPVSANKYWIDTIARKTYGLNGYVTGDCGAIDDITNGHFYAEDHPEATAMGLKAGVDTDCGAVYQANALNALEEGLINEADMDLALVNIFTVRMRIGEFDPKDKVPYSTITGEVVNTPEHNAMALEVATRTPVLLKNEPVPGTSQNALPLQPEEVKKIAVFGPLAERIELGPYSGLADEAYSITPVNGIRNWIAENGLNTEVSYRSGAHTISRSDIFYVSDFEIVASDGTVTTYDATQFDDAAVGVLVSTYRQNALRGIKDGDWTSYNNIDIDNIERINLNLMATGPSGVIEARVGSPTGRLLASFPIEGHQDTGMGGFARFGSARNVSSRVNRIGPAEDQPLVFVYQVSETAPIDQETISLASSSDVAIVYVGTDDRTASEEADRYTLLLPGNQYELIKAVSEVNSNTIVVIQSLGMVEVETFKNLPNVTGIIWTGYNGQAQGTALAHILFGKVNPGGKLNATWYRLLDDLPELTDYELKGGNNKNGRTYWYFDKDVSYEFGFGLSYTTYEYSNFNISKTDITPNDRITVSVDVSNTGNRDGEEVVQVYVKTPDSPASLQRPIKRLKGFRRIAIPVGTTSKVEIDIDCSDLWFWDPDTKRMTYDPGEYVFEIGASSKDIHGEVSATMSGALKAAIKTVTAECGKVVLKPDEKVQTSVTAVMTDDSFYDMSKARVAYKSSDPAVASVNRAGMVTARSAGVASITATVTIDGQKEVDNYVIKVAPDLNLKSLVVGGTELSVFSPEVHAYSILLPGDTGEAPQVTATTSNDASLTIAQAEKIPGTAVITVTDNLTGEKGLYKVNFGMETSGDEFDGNTLGEQWSMVRESEDHWSISGGQLVVDLQSGSLQSSRNDAKNILLKDANSDWTIATRLVLPEGPPSQLMQSGLIAYQDDDNYVKFIYKSSGRMEFGPEGFLRVLVETVELAYEIEGAEYTMDRFEMDEELARQREIELTLKKTGDQYTGICTIGEKEISLEGSPLVLLNDIRAGLMAYEGESSRGWFPIPVPMGPSAEPEGVKIGYDYFRISPSGVH